MHHVTAWTLSVAFLVLGIADPAAIAAGETPVTLSPGLQPQRSALVATIGRAQDRLRRFAAQHGWEHVVGQGFLHEIRIFDSKDAFDAIVKGGSGTLPGSFVGVVIGRRLLAVSPQVYAKVHWEHRDPEAWEKLLTHEMAHQLHVDILNGREEGMGPVWFYEGFAAVAADQYRHDLPTLTKEGRQHLLAELRRGSYRNYEAMLRFYMAGAPLPELVRQASLPGFLSWLQSTFDEVPVPAPTPLDIYQRSM